MHRGSNVTLGALLTALLTPGCGESATAARGPTGLNENAGAAGVGGTSTQGASGSTGDGASGSTSSAAGSAGAPIPVHTPGTCAHLAPPGTWEQITPPEVLPQMPGPGSCRYGTGAFVVDASTDAIYLGTCNMGIWKSTDCGSTWLHVNTGTNGKVLDGGRQWTFAIDPSDPRVLYTNSGYGSMSNGAFKSTDGGVNWEEMWPPKDAELAKVVDYNFVNQIILDPYDHQHILMTWHAVCKAPYNSVCIGESKDAGATWKLLNGNPGWMGGEGQSAYFLNDSKTWLWESQSNGVWRTGDGGATWDPLAADQAGHGGGQLYRAHDGTFYLAVNGGIVRSTDGITWTLIKVAGPLGGLTSDGTTMYASRWSAAQAGEGENYLPFWSSPESDGMNWTQVKSPSISDGGPLRYDFDHHVLYSSNVYAGFWRVVTP